MGIIKKLSPLLASRIAAGEVIDRPQSVVRELLDNAIDAKADDITLNIVNGGLDLISVKDNGSGIAKEDLDKTILAHCTSKISELDDLYNLSTLGFRGEALYSIASISRLSITSSKDGKAYTFVTDNGNNEEIVDSNLNNGTFVKVENLFLEVPARRNFLKRPSSEASLCKNMLIQKAMTFPNVKFTFLNNNEIVLSLPKRDSIEDRVLDILTLDSKLNRSDFIVLSTQEEEYRIKVITSLPSVYTRDRSKIKVYLNNRNIDEYSFIQAITYGYNDILFGGAFPYSVLLIDNKAEYVDFNIHPAKREAHIRNKATIHNSITQLLKRELVRTHQSIVATITNVEYKPESVVTKTFEDDFTSSNIEQFNKTYTPSTNLNSTYVPPSESVKPSDNSWFEKAKELLNKTQEKKFEVESKPMEDIWSHNQDEFKYLGQLFKLFLLVEKDDQLLLIDQHAAHERLLFEKLKNNTCVQNLLISIDFEVSKDIDLFLIDNWAEYKEYGIIIERKADMLWSLVALPSIVRSVEKLIIDAISNTLNPSDISAKLYAIVACKAAIKAGDELDRYTAEELIRNTFTLDEPICPHGRSFIVSLDKKELYKMVGRIV